MLDLILMPPLLLPPESMAAAAAAAVAVACVSMYTIPTWPWPWGCCGCGCCCGVVAKDAVVGEAEVLLIPPLVGIILYVVLTLLFAYCGCIVEEGGASW